jgi:hypothetical protein
MVQDKIENTICSWYNHFALSFKNDIDYDKNTK